MPDFQRVFPGLITCCRSPTCLPRLCPGHYLSLLSSTKSFAYSLLVTLLLGSVATQLTTGPVYQLGNPSAVDFTFSQRHQARSCSDLADDHCEQRLFTLPLFELLKTAVNNKGHYRLVFRLPVLLFGPHHIRDKVDAGWIGFWSTVGGCVFGVAMARFADSIRGMLKLILVLMLAGASLSSTWFTLTCLSRYTHLPSTAAILYTSCILVGIFINSSVPIFFELFIETVYPVPEGITCGVVTFLGNLVTGLLLFFLTFYCTGRMIGIVVKSRLSKSRDRAGAELKHTVPAGAPGLRCKHDLISLYLVWLVIGALSRCRRVLACERKIRERSSRRLRRRRGCLCANESRCRWLGGVASFPSALHILQLSWLNWCLTGSCVFSLVLVLCFRESYDRLYLDVFVSV
ncbi:unnamed protein product [Pleuronectes platessa]|uniref:Uncharacterized protein n=1 Tax=Pleuronectes platessa TaxID=8262 RepID=A0A9N7UR03_PLEPL|nr:unnamed protein product [Pleuronectes platessa]